MTACKVLADEYEKKGSAHIATKLRADAANMRKAVMAPRKRVGVMEVGGLNNRLFLDGGDGGVLYSNRVFYVPWGWFANNVPSLGATAWSIMEGEDFNPFVLGGDSSNVPGVHTPPRVRVEAMATGKSAGLYRGARQTHSI